LRPICGAWRKPPVIADPDFLPKSLPERTESVEDRSSTDGRSTETGRFLAPLSVRRKWQPLRFKNADCSDDSSANTTVYVKGDI
jgi:hypothetical protein